MRDKATRATVDRSVCSVCSSQSHTLRSSPRHNLQRRSSGREGRNQSKAHRRHAGAKEGVLAAALVGDEPSRPTGGFVRDGVPDLGPEAPRAPDGGRAARKF